MKKVNLLEKLDRISEYWNPAIVGELNGQHVRLAKIKGEFPMHKHEQEDEMFLVLKGSLQMDFGDHLETVSEGEFIIVPRGTAHRPIAEAETHIMLFEPATVINTGDLESSIYTRDTLRRL